MFDASVRFSSRTRWIGVDPVAEQSSLPLIDGVLGVNVTVGAVQASDAAPPELPLALGVPDLPQPVRATARAAPVRTTALVRSFMVASLLEVVRAAGSGAAREASGRTSA